MNAVARLWDEGVTVREKGSGSDWRKETMVEWAMRSS